MMDRKVVACLCLLYLCFGILLSVGYNRSSMRCTSKSVDTKDFIVIYKTCSKTKVIKIRKDSAIDIKKL